MSLTNRADEASVTQGPGGTSVVVDRDSLVGVPPSQQGITRSDVFKFLTNEPQLAPAFLADLSSADAKLSQTLLNYAFTLFGMEAGMSSVQSFQNKGTEDSSVDDLSFIRDAMKEFQTEESTSANDPTLQGTTPLPQSADEEDPLDALMKTISALASSIGNVSEENSGILKTLTSTDPKAVTAMLIAQSGIEENPDISPEDMTMLQSQFQKLGEMIAKGNENGGSPILSMTISGFLLASFAKSLDINGNTSLTPEQKELLAASLNTAAEKISAANTQKIATREDPSPEYLQLTSDNPEEVSTILTSLYSNVNLSKLTEDQKKELSSIMDKVAEKMATGSYDPELKIMLMSNNPEVVSKALTSIMGDISSKSPLVQHMITTAILPAISQGMGSINETELDQMLKSDNQDQIETALGILSGVATDKTMPPTVKKILIDYMKALTEALVFMAQIRSLITRLEGAFTQAIASAKLSTTSEQVKNAMELYLTKCEEIQKKYTENADKIRTALILKILMPIISILLLVIAVIVLVVSLIAAIPTGGASAAVGLAVVAKIIALVVALCVTAAVLVFTVVDAIVSWTTNKSILEHVFSGVQDETTRKGLIMGFNIGLTVGVAVFTFGVAIASAVAVSVAQGISAGLKAIMELAFALIKEALKQLFTGPIGAQMLGLIMGAVMSSGFVQDVVMKIFKAMGCDDQTAMILTMVAMLLLMLSMLLVTCGKSIIGGIKGLAAGAKEIGKQVSEAVSKAVEQGVTQTLKQIAEKIKDAIKEFMSNIMDQLKKLFDLKPQGATEGIAATAKDAAKTAMDSAMTATERVLKRMMDILKENAMLPANLMKLLASMLQIATQAVVAVSAGQRAELNKDIAKLEREGAALEAVMTFLRAAGVIGPNATLDALSESSKQMFENWKELCNMVARFILDASQRTTELHSKAG